MLGNLSVEQMEERLGVEFPEPFRSEFLKKYHLNANIKAGPDRWHCFDLPFTLVVGDQALLEEVIKNLGPLGGAMTGSMNVGVAG